MNKVYGVLLTELGWNDLEYALRGYYREGDGGKYIYCSKVEPDGPFFVMHASRTNDDGSKFDAEISIPHHYVKFVICGAEEKQLGFS